MDKKTVNDRTVNSVTVKRLLAVLLGLLLFVNSTPLPVYALDAVAYVDEDGVAQSVSDYTVMTHTADYYTMSDGVYVVQSDLSFNGTINVSGDATLILCDGYTLQSRTSVNIASDASLTVYGQSGGTGTLNANSSYPVFSDNRRDSIIANGSLTVNSGTVIASGTYQHAGISGAGVITVNGGSVTATGGDSAPGIGASYNDANANATGSLIVNGGTVSATGGSNGAGIGGAAKTGTATGGSWGTVTVNGGTVTAISGGSAAGIGCGYVTNCGDVTINGGTVNATATAGTYTGEAIGKYRSNNGLSGTIGTVTVTGGNVTANGSIGGSSTVLGWTSASDSIYATSYTSSNITFTDVFVLENTAVIATAANAGGHTIVPFTGTMCTVSFVDDDGLTELCVPVDVVPGGVVSAPAAPSKYGYDFVEWQLNGVAYDFSTAVTSDITLQAVWSERIPVSYIDENGATQSVLYYTEINNSHKPTTLTAGWYVVTENVTYPYVGTNSRLGISGDVKLILADGCTLTAAYGIYLPTICTLTIYAQSGGTGALVADVAALGSLGKGVSGIGGNGGTNVNTYYNTASGTLIVNGGTVTAKGGENAAGIGGGWSNTHPSGNMQGGTVVINGGTVTAVGGAYAAGIGGGNGGHSTAITVNGGTVNATGGSYAAGLGGGYLGNGGTVTVNGGTVNANRIGGGSGLTATIDLGWTSTADRISANNYDGTVTFHSDFLLDGTTELATASNVAGHTLVPFTGGTCTVTCLDEDDNTQLYQFRVASGYAMSAPAAVEKAGYQFLGWQLNGVDYDFSTPVTTDVTLTAHYLYIGDVAYIDENGAAQTLAVGNYRTLTSSNTNITTAGWYVVAVDTTISSITIRANVNLVLMDGVTLTVNDGVRLDNCNFAVYGQAGGTGTLNASATSIYYGGIAGAYYVNCGNITINGGIINASSANYGAAIGSSYYRACGTITINGGTVTATGGKGAAIGSGAGGSFGGVVINGGTVIATASNTAAIGGSFADGATININGGNVTATATNGGTGIGRNPSVTEGGTVNLAWTAATDSIETSSYLADTINFVDDFILSGTSTLATAANSGGARIIPAVTHTVRFLDTDGVTELCAPQAVYITNAATLPTDAYKDGNPVQYWALNGVEYDFATIVTDDIDLTPVCFTVSFADTDGTTPLAPAQTVLKGYTATQPTERIDNGHYRVAGWKLGGAAYNFATPVTADVTLTAAWGVPYIDQNGVEQICAEYQVIVSGSSAMTSDGWYVVDEDVTLTNRLAISTGDVHLILCDGASLTSQRGVTVPYGTGLTVYAQSGGTGALIANPQKYSNAAGIGGRGTSSVAFYGDITICGGNITATGGENAAGIGGGHYPSASANGTIRIYGGNVTATGGKDAAGIGGGCGTSGGTAYKNSETIFIYGGTVTATGNGAGAGIGTGDFEETATVEIRGGNVTATGGTCGAGIGLSADCDRQTESATVKIYGGTVNAHSIQGAGIGTGDATSVPCTVHVYIAGGNVTATSDYANGIGVGIDSALSTDSTIDLNWTNIDDSITCSYFNVEDTYTCTINNFVLRDNPTVAATVRNANGKTIVPGIEHHGFALKDDAEIEMVTTANDLLIVIRATGIYTLDDLRTQFKNFPSQITAQTGSGADVSGTDAIGTGYTVNCISVLDDPGAVYQTAHVVLCGDVTGDGFINTDDYTAAKGLALGDSGTDYQIAAADLNGDGMVDVLDCRLLKLLSQGKALPA